MIYKLLTIKHSKEGDEYTPTKYYDVAVDNTDFTNYKVINRENAKCVTRIISLQSLYPFNLIIGHNLLRINQ